jgi:Fe-S-cluster containining protein
MASENETMCEGLFDCTLCGDCCKGFGGTYVTETDMKAIARFVDVPVDKFIAEYTRQSGNRRVLDQGKNGYCIFWDKVCTIHPVKPEMCRRWPFIRPILVDVSNWRAMSASCPGMNPDAPDQQVVECVKKMLKE